MRLVSFIATCVTCASLWACSSGSPLVVTSASARPAGGSNTSTDVLFAADSANDRVLMYRRHHARLIETLHGLKQAQGIAVDSAANLYVASLNDYGTIEVFAPPYKTVSRTLVVQGSLANAVAVATSGNVVAIQQTQMELVGAGTSEVCTVFGPPPYEHLGGGAFDANDNLYFDGTDTTGHPSISIWPNVRCNYDPTSYPLSTGNKLSSAGCLAFGPNATIAVLDSQAKVLYTYAAPKNKSLGRPIHKTPLTGISSPVAFAFTPGGHGIFVSDGATGTVDKFNYPQGGVAIKSIDISGQPSGVAVGPGLLP